MATLDLVCNASSSKTWACVMLRSQNNSDNDNCTYTQLISRDMGCCQAYKLIACGQSEFLPFINLQLLSIFQLQDTKGAYNLQPRREYHTSNLGYASTTLFIHFPCTFSILPATSTSRVTFPTSPSPQHTPHPNP